MIQSTQSNRRIVLASRPHGAPTPANFRLEENPLRPQQTVRCCCARCIYPLIPICVGA